MDYEETRTQPSEFSVKRGDHQRGISHKKSVQLEQTRTRQGPRFLRRIPTSSGNYAGSPRSLGGRNRQKAKTYVVGDKSAGGAEEGDGGGGSPARRSWEDSSATESSHVVKHQGKCIAWVQGGGQTHHELFLSRRGEEKKSGERNTTACPSR